MFPLQSISAEQAKRFTKFRERKGLIDKDVVPKNWHNFSILMNFIKVSFVLKFLSYIVISSLFQGKDRQVAIILRRR